MSTTLPVELLASQFRASVLTAALGYARAAYRVAPIYPVRDGRCTCSRPACDSPGKHPMLDDWRAGASSREADVRRRWEQSPEAGIIAPTGDANGFDVLDIDPRHGGSLEGAEKLFGPFGKGPMARSGGGGWHLYFRHTPALGKGELAPGYDLAGSGGGIILPPSRHASGDCYSWEPGRALGEVRLLDPPKALLRAWEQRKALKLAPTSGSGKAPSVLVGIPEGRRNEALFGEAARLRGLGVREDEAQAVVLHAAAAAVPPFDDREAAGIVARVFSKYPAGTPRPCPVCHKPEPCAEHLAVPPSGTPAVAAAEPGDAAPSADQFPATESGDAEFFAAEYASTVRYDHARRRWVAFSGHRWHPQSEGEVDYLALLAMRKRYAAAAGDPAKMKWCAAGESAARRRHLLELARLEPGLRDSGAGWDANHRLLGCLNGTVDLATGELLPGQPGDMITMACGADWDLNAKSGLWERVVLRALPDPMVRRFYQKLAGLTLAGETGENVLVLMRGPTRTAKGTIQEALANALGDYATNASLGLLAERDERAGPKPELVRLRGSRMVGIYESSKNLRLDPALTKTITGSDPITARGLYQDEITFKPLFLVWIATNVRPKAPSDDDALWERIREVPFLVHIPEGERDPQVRADLADPQKHGSAILAWAWRGLEMYRAEGLEQPDAVRVATRSYRGECDPCRPFLDACCVLKATGREADRPWTSARDLRTEYEVWARENGERPARGTDLAAALADAGCSTQKRGQVRGWLGVGLVAGGDVS